MKLLHFLLTAFFSLITLFGCTNTYNAQVNQNLLKEQWIRHVNLNPMIWTRNADRWFFTGEPNATEKYATVAPTDKAMTIMAVNVAQFTKVQINGCFQVQLVGEQDKNSVYILGPNEAVRQTVVQVWGDTVVVNQVTNGKAGMANLKNVIVRIGVRNLRSLKVSGTAAIEGRNLTSDGLVIQSNNNGNMLLSGDVNLLKVTNTGAGTISVIGAYTPCLNIVVNGSGTVNVSGRVGVQSIDNCGSGKVSIIGADSNSLIVNAAGNSTTTVAGYVNLKKLTAYGAPCIYMYWVTSNGAHITLRNNARVGLAGSITNLDLTLSNNARFAGQYLHGGNVYVQTRDYSHANISADKKIFASAINNSSIYFFGSPNIVSRYSADQGSVIPVWSETNELPVPMNAPRFIRTAKSPMVGDQYK